MANWSTDNFYFGCLYDAEQEEQARLEYQASVPIKIAVARSNLEDHSYHGEYQRILSRLAWEPPGLRGWPYRVGSISEVGPALCIHGEGRWGSPMPLAPETWDWLNTQVVVWEGTSGFDDYLEQTIVIAGENVYLKKYEMYPEPEDELDTSIKFVGRTAEERHFFQRLYPAIQDKKRLRRMEQATFLDRIKGRNRGVNLADEEENGRLG